MEATVGSKEIDEIHQRNALAISVPNDCEKRLPLVLERIKEIVTVINKDLINLLAFSFVKPLVESVEQLKSRAGDVHDLVIFWGKSLVFLVF